MWLCSRCAARFPEQPVACPVCGLSCEGISLVPEDAAEAEKESLESPLLRIADRVRAVDEPSTHAWPVFYSTFWAFLLLGATGFALILVSGLYRQAPEPGMIFLALWVPFMAVVFALCVSVVVAFAEMFWQGMRARPLPKPPTRKVDAARTDALLAPPAPEDSHEHITPDLDRTEGESERAATFRPEE